MDENAEDAIGVEAIEVAAEAADAAEGGAAPLEVEVDVEVEVSEPSSRKHNGRLIGGIVLVALGFLFLIDDLFMLDVGYVWNFWPLMLIAFGVSKLTRGRGRGGGFFLIVLGPFFLFDELDLLYAEDSWPVLIMALGAIMISSSLLRQRQTPESS